MSQNNQTSNLIWLGTIVNTHGVKGELRILSDSDDIENRFSKGNKLLYYKGNQLESFTIASMRLHKQFILVTFEGINNINDIEWIKGTKVYCERKDDDDIYVVDVVGSKVIDTDNNEIGEVESYHDAGPYFNYIIKFNNGNTTNIPDVKEFIIGFDKDEKILRVNIPTELLGEK